MARLWETARGLVLIAAYHYLQQSDPALSVYSVSGIIYIFSLLVCLLVPQALSIFLSFAALRASWDAVISSRRSSGSTPRGSFGQDPHVLTSTLSR